MLMGQYSDHVLAFFRINSLHLLLSGLFTAWLLGRSRVEALRRGAAIAGSARS